MHYLRVTHSVRTYRKSCVANTFTYEYAILVIPFSPFFHRPLFYRRGGVAGMTDWVTPSKIVTFLLVRVMLKPPPRPLPSSLIGVPAASSNLASFPMKFSLRL